MIPTLVLVLAAAPSDAFLNGIAKHFEAIDEFQKNARITAEFTSTELDADGKVTKTSTQKRHTTTVKGVETIEVVSATKDGKDVTQEQQEKARKPKGKDSELFLPFENKVRSKYQFALLEQKEPGKVRIAFQPKGEKSSELFMGEALVNQETFEVISCSVRYSKNPTFVDHLTIDFEFDAPTPVGKALSRMVLKGDGGIAFIHRRGSQVSLFSDYRAVP
jgi:hypothetical protein